MKVDTRFPLHVAIALLAGLALSFLFLRVTGNDSSGVLAAVVIGAVLSTVNVMSGFFAIEYSHDKSYNTLLKFVLGGMGIRMGTMLGILALLIKFSGLHTIALVVSVLGFYVVFLILEILYIQKKVSLKNQS